MTATFTAQVDAWVKATKQRLDAVIRESAQRVVEEAQRPVAKGGNMPVDTGFLRASMNFALGQPIMVRATNPGGAHTFDEGQLALVLAGMEAGDTFYATYAANYAIYVEYGARARPGRAFVRSAAAQWPQIVNRVVAEARSRASR